MKRLLVLAALGVVAGCGGRPVGGTHGAAGTAMAVVTGAAGGGPSEVDGLPIIADLSKLSSAPFNAPLYKMWGTGLDNLWLVGGGNFPGEQGAQTRLVNFRTSGEAIQVRELVPPGVNGPLMAIWGAAADDIWVLGDHAFAHFDGKIWSRVEGPFGDASEPPFGVTNGAFWGASRSDVWFVGARRAMHWDGKSWSLVPIPGGAAYGLEADDLLSVWGFSSTDVWAGGGSGTLIHWDGVRWSSVKTGEERYVYGLWGANPSALWGVGNGGYRLRWDGTGLIQTREDYTSFVAIGGRAADDVWGVGECCWNQGGRRVAWFSRFDGAQWVSTSVKEAISFQDVWVGADGTVLALTDYTKLLRLR